MIPPAWIFSVAQQSATFQLESFNDIAARLRQSLLVRRTNLRRRGVLDGRGAAGYG